MIERVVSPEIFMRQPGRPKGAYRSAQHEGTSMKPKEQELRDKLVRNFNSAEMAREERAPLYAGAAARLARMRRVCSAR